MAKIIDNFLPKEEHEKIYNLMFNESNFPWFYVPDISFKNKHSKSHLFYMVHLFYFNDKPNSDFFDRVSNLLKRIKIKALIRVKANFYPNQGIKKIDEMHTDASYKHKAAIYSVNTNNGGTVLEDGTIVKSIANRLLLFDASKKHDSTNCTDQKARVNININYF